MRVPVVMYDPHLQTLAAIRFARSLDPRKGAAHLDAIATDSLFAGELLAAAAELYEQVGDCERAADRYRKAAKAMLWSERAREFAIRAYELEHAHP
ncbi:MAG: hypothetical protein QM831_19450 [Kofleriaceae bacterium]